MSFAGEATTGPDEIQITTARRRRAPLSRLFLRRLATGVLTLIAASMLIFAATDLLPGSPASNALGKFATPEQTHALNEKLGFNHPLPVRYWNWLSGAVRGDLGDSAVGTANSGAAAPIWPLIHDRLLNTLTLALTTALLLVPLALLFGTIAALRAGKLADHTISTALLATISLPEFVTGTLLVLLFFSLLGWLAPNSFIAPGSPAIHHPKLLVLPVLTLLAASVAWAARLVRAGVLETLGSEYVQAARLHGLPEGRIVRRYAMRNALAPSVQVFAVSIVMAALLVPHTTCKIAILGNAISLRDHPLRVAEEIAVLDVVSGGRIISGFVRGIGSEYHAFSLDPTQSRDRFYEAHDLIVKAWTEPGPFEWYGEHFKLRYVNPWPRPLQQPHPPIWSPSLGSNETIDWAARNHYTYLQTYTDMKTLRRVFGELKEATVKHGYEAPPEQIGWSLPIYVADTDEQAVKEARPHLEYLFNVGLRMPKNLFFPAGYLTPQGMARIMAAKSGLVAGGMTIETLMEKGFVAVGSPDTVRQQIEEVQKELGFGTLVANFHFATMPHESFMSSLHLFADRVMPALKGLGSREPVGAAAG